MSRDPKATTSELFSSKYNWGPVLRKTPKKLSEPRFFICKMGIPIVAPFTCLSVALQITYVTCTVPSASSPQNNKADATIPIAFLSVPFYSSVNCGSEKLGTQTLLKPWPNTHTFPTASPPKLDINEFCKAEGVPTRTWI